MGAFGRLWARAPLWRWSLFLALAGVAMTLVYPPAWLAPAGSPTSRQASVPVPAPVASAPAPPRVTLPAGIPAVGDSYSGSLPLGGQSVPLPAGRWTVLAAAAGASAGDVPAASVFLATWLGGRLTAAAVISGSTVPEPRGAGFAAPLEAQVPSFYYRRVIAAIDHGALDMWVCGTTAPARWNDTLRQTAITALRQQNVALPQRLESAVFRLADTRNWLSGEFMFAEADGATPPPLPWTQAALEPAGAALAHIERVRRWGKAWHGVMLRGFAGRLAPGEAEQLAFP